MTSPSTKAPRRIALGTVGSTNSIALEAARAGDPGDLWITAEEQSEGKGRRGRTWISSHGNLYASLLLVDPAPLSQLSSLPLVASLGVRNGISALPARRSVDVGIKWPNDVLLSGRKAVGILLESEMVGGGLRAVVIGIGVNVARAPEGTPYPVTALAEHGVMAGPEDVFQAIASGVSDALALWKHGQGLAAVRAAWLDHAVGVGEPCRVNLNDQSLEGIFDSLDAEGRLVLRRQDGGFSTIASGDVFLLGAEDKARS
ncbi:biotin--[acetyl-CoA-carboxylase] ligase [Consotaella salsifontis]|uniref:biotin--[biotin carboxyl-carrier protein] ligase n=1 Tax=Consotaella salsifontis TaxID=1365950 RepID=A0A1T4LMS2_9HYPH|nr:biotin--[acetyl-CoA-carboxylase] ligase [Consotaella salsifontis]SJZ55936.1 BirA family transcriptional regulator, biotin operon repressor / biotin-[acetyl-CoA-carboxylase] ligase [Consotaella salsifontis]